MTAEREVMIREEHSVSVLEGDSPAARVAFAAETAKALAPVIDKGRLFVMISGRKHVLYEGWTTLGQMLGVFPVTVWTKPLVNGYEARVEARTRGGQVVGAAEAECTRDEAQWKNRDDYALRSMAQTRAGSKALRMCLGFIVVLGGYDATPAEEMSRDEAVSEPEPDIERTPCPLHPENGQRAYKKGTKGGKKWAGLFCSVKDCPPEWLHLKGVATLEAEAVQILAGRDGPTPLVKQPDGTYAPSVGQSISITDDEWERHLRDTSPEVPEGPE